MKIPEQVMCKICKRIFCCAKCRGKHEFTTHAIAVKYNTKAMANTAKAEGTIATVTADNEAVSLNSNNNTIYIFCPICEEKPLVLQDFIYDELLSHIQNLHLPLHCQKCNKLYTKITDLQEFTKCLNKTLPCEQRNGQSTSNSCNNITNQTTDTADASKETVKKATIAHNTISTQTSPMHLSQVLNKDFNDTGHVTPISIINMRWKAKNKIMHEEFTSDSVSSIKNSSSINNSSTAIQRGIIAQIQPTINKGKLIRSTSTPLQLGTVFAKPNQPTFNASGGHVSSIYNSGLEAEQSPAVSNNSNGTPAQTIENLNRYQKAPGRNKIISVTPLRQVMSKSIQKAFVEHGGLPIGNAPEILIKRNDIFEFGNNSACYVGAAGAITNDLAATNTSMPLDLRLSPALRRTQSEGGGTCHHQSDNKQHVEQRKILLSSQKLTTESIIITCTKRIAASVETATNSIQTNLSIGSSMPDGNSSTISNAANSVYKSCESVEIITSTAELSAVSMPDSINKGSIKKDIKHCEVGDNDDGGKHLVSATPITRIPSGAIINKKLIKFETPQIAINSAQEQSAITGVSPTEIFYTPCPSTPVRKIINEKKQPEYKHMPRKLSRQFTAQTRPLLRHCAQTAAFSDLENNRRDTIKVSSNDEKGSNKYENKKTQLTHAGRLWSLMTSAIRLPKFKSDSSSDVHSVSKVNSIIKRCASFAGSLVRTRSMCDEDNVQTLKRKRTYTFDSQMPYTDNIYSADSSSSSIYSKRLRIHCRKPIQRMRCKN